MSRDYFNGDGIDDSKVDCPHCVGEGEIKVELSEKDKEGLTPEEIEEVEKNPDYEICTTCQGDGQVDEDTAKECAGYFDSEFN